MKLSEFSHEELQRFRDEQAALLADYKSQGLKLDMSRGKPNSEQLNLTNDMLTHCLDGDHISERGVDCRNYGVVDGRYASKRLLMTRQCIGS